MYSQTCVKQLYKTVQFFCFSDRWLLIAALKYYSSEKLHELSALLLFSNKQPPPYSDNGWWLKTGLSVTAIT